MRVFMWIGILLLTNLAHATSYTLPEDFYVLKYTLVKGIKKAKQAVVIHTPQLTWDALGYALITRAGEIEITLYTATPDTPMVNRLRLYRGVTIVYDPSIQESALSIDGIPWLVTTENFTQEAFMHAFTVELKTASARH